MRRGEGRRRRCGSEAEEGEVVVILEKRRSLRISHGGERRRSVCGVFEEDPEEG